MTFNNGILFRTKNFIPDYRYTLNFVDAWSVDEIIILDITREKEKNRNYFFDAVTSFSEKCFVPLTVGGGVRKKEDFAILCAFGSLK